MSINPPNTGSGKWWAGFVASLAATFVISHLETNYGIDFSKEGMDAGIFKGLLEGSFVSFFVWVTPGHLVDSVTDVIIFIRTAILKWRNAANDPLNK